MFKVFRKSYPQSFIIKKPLAGSAIIAIACFAFVMLYRPLNTHSSGNFTYFQTMGIYATALLLGLFIMISVIKQLKFFKAKNQWTLGKELLFLLLISLSMGIIIYLSAYVIEPASERLNFATLFDSVKNAFLIGLIPLILFTFFNYGFLHSKPVHIKYENDKNELSTEKPVKIESQLKKEHLQITPHEFVYAEAEGNYVTFFLNIDGRLTKKSIRNTISAIDKQLHVRDEFFRCHRAFIINLKYVKTKRGNSSGYRIKLKNVENEIPVSRNRTAHFKEKLKNFEVN